VAVGGPGLEQAGIELRRFEAEHVPRRLGDQDLGGRARRPERLEDAPEPGDVDLEGADGPGRRLIPPQEVDEAVEGHDSVDLDEQDRQHCPLLWAAEIEDLTRTANLEGPQHPELFSAQP
jgi:hypothetical protein